MGGAWEAREGRVEGAWGAHGWRGCAQLEPSGGEGEGAARTVVPAAILRAPRAHREGVLPRGQATLLAVDPLAALHVRVGRGDGAIDAPGPWEEADIAVECDELARVADAVPPPGDHLSAGRHRAEQRRRRPWGRWPWAAAGSATSRVGSGHKVVHGKVAGLAGALVGVAGSVQHLADRVDHHQAAIVIWYHLRLARLFARGVRLPQVAHVA